MTRHQTWGEDRVMYFDTAGTLRSILASWTNLADEDAFIQVSAGRSWFRTDDLLRLNLLIGECHPVRTP